MSGSAGITAPRNRRRNPSCRRPHEQRDYDPWEPVNERVFSFNYDLVDHYGLKPVATVWARLPELVTQGLVNAFDNIDMPKRFVNNVLQGQTSRRQPRIDPLPGQFELWVWPEYSTSRPIWVLRRAMPTPARHLAFTASVPDLTCVLPFMQPLTLRDGIGYAADTFLDPIGYLAPFAANFARSAVKRINERAVNLTLYQDVEDSSLDLYSAVRNGYLQRREHSIRRAIRERNSETEWSLLRKLFSDDDTRRADHG